MSNMRQPGVQIMINNEKDLVWISSSNDNLAILRQKMAALNSCINGNRSYEGMLPTTLTRDIREKGDNVFNIVYVLTYDKEQAIDYLRDNDIEISPKKLLNVLKAYVRHNLFYNYGIYGTEDWFRGNKTLSNNYSIDILNMIERNIIQIYKTTDLEHGVAKYFRCEETTLEEMLQYKYKHKNKNKDIKEAPSIDTITGEIMSTERRENTDMSTENNKEEVNRVNEVLNNYNNEVELNKLLEIESVLRGHDSKEEFIKSLISDKAIKLYERIIK